MTSMLTAVGDVWALPDAPAESPYDALVQCAIPTPYGTGQTIHPSVVDMGRRWHGYRWWMVNTPFVPAPGTGEPLENPCIFGSNDRITWHVPPGLTNPIDPWPGGQVGRPSTAFNSDPELVWDPDERRLICYWRDTESFTPDVVDFYAAESYDGVTWTHHEGPVLTITAPDAARSPGISRVSATEWRMWCLSNTVPSRLYSAPGPFGPWEYVAPLTRNGGAFYGWHGDFRYQDGVCYALVGSTTTGPFYPSVSLDGLAWIQGAAVLGEGYRTAIVPPVDGMVEVWYSTYATCIDSWTRIPASHWTDLIP